MKQSSLVPWSKVNRSIAPLPPPPSKVLENLLDRLQVPISKTWVDTLILSTVRGKCHAQDINTKHCSSSYLGLLVQYLTN